VVVEPLPPQPAIAAPKRTSHNTHTANAGLAIWAGTLRLQRRSRPRNTGKIGRIQKIGNRFQGVVSREKGAEGIHKAFTVVLTLIPTVVGVCATITDEDGPLHVAFAGAPVQLTVTVS
jgi:hypothetical protein